MAFIPIHAKADISTGEGAKKGKITPAQASILNAWCLANKTGILDCLDKCIAKEENITNVENNEAVITFRSGFLVICGRLIECEDGTQVVIRTPVTGSSSGKIIAKLKYICYHKRVLIAELCNGSTNDSDSFCLGSNPGSAATENGAFV